MATDLTKMPLEILVDLINETNGTALSTADVTFSAPGVMLTGSRNTGITATARPSSPYEGSRDMTYNRIDFSIIPGNRSIRFVRENAMTVKDMIPQINAAYLLNLQPEDYFDDPLPGFGDNQDTDDVLFVLRAKPNSVVYRNQVSLSLAGNKIDLAGLIIDDLLDGFNYTVMIGELLNGFSYTSPGDKLIWVTSQSN